MLVGNVLGSFFTDFFFILISVSYCERNLKIKHDCLFSFQLSALVYFETLLSIIYMTSGTQLLCLCVVFPYNPLNSGTPAGCSIIQLISDTTQR